MQVAAQLLTVDDLLVAVNEEIEMPPRLLPLDVATQAAANRRAEVTSWVQGNLAGTFHPTLEETVAASKSGHGVRPIAIWDLQSRVLYRTLARRVAASLAPLERGRTQWKAFQRAPLDFPGKYVVGSDIAACYQYIDHGLLVEELAVQSRESEAVEAIAALLKETTDRAYGLPQQSRPSDVLAEAFLGRLERRLVRRGLQVSRYNDDFRFTCHAWSDAVRAIEVFSEEARRLGLTMNDLKTLTWKRETYEAHLDEADRIRNDIAQEAAFDLTRVEIDWYDATVVETPPDADEVGRLAAVRILERWTKVAARSQVPARRKAEHRAIVELLPYALTTLTANHDAIAETLGDVMKLLRFERTLTPSVAGLLAACPDSEMVVEEFDKLLKGRAYLNGWQAWWLQRSVARLPGFASGAGASRRIGWVREALAAEHAPVLRAAAALALAHHKQISPAQILALYDRSGSASRPPLVAAMALLRPANNVRRSVTGGSALHTMVYDWALSNA